MPAKWAPQLGAGLIIAILFFFDNSCALTNAAVLFPYTI